MKDEQTDVLTKQLHSDAFREYEILQGKIDNLGAHRFRVKTWSVTLTLGGLAGGKFAGLIGSPYFLFVLAIPFIFGILEYALMLDIKHFGKRAKLLEDYIQQLRSRENRGSIVRTLRRLPGLAHSIYARKSYSFADIEFQNDTNASQEDRKNLVLGLLAQFSTQIFYGGLFLSIIGSHLTSKPVETESASESSSSTATDKSAIQNIRPIVSPRKK